MHIMRRLGLLLAVFLLVVATASTAVAATKITNFASLSVGVIGSGSESVMIVTGTLPQEAQLPATVELAVPKGSAILWFGEVDTGESNGDFEIDKKVRTEGNWDIYTTTATKFKRVQVEVTPTQSYLNLDANGAGLATLPYAPANDVGTLQLGVELPTTAKFTPKANYEDLGKGMTGQVYGTTFTNVKAGAESKAEFQFTNVLNEAQSAATKGGSTSTLIIVLVVLLVAALGVLIIIMAKGKASKSSTAVNKKPSGGSSKSSSSTSKSQPARSNTSKPASASSASPEKGKKRVNPAFIITGVIAVVGIAGMLLAGTFSNKVTMVNGVYMKEFAQGDPCSSVSFTLTDKAIADPEKAADDIFTTIEDSSLIAMKASLDSATNKLTVEFCESNETGANIEKVLEPTGLVGESNAVAIGQVIPQESGAFSIYANETAPCVTNIISIDKPESDGAAQATKLFEAVKAVPSFTGLTWDPATKTVSFGYCDESANDDAFIAALKAAGISGKINTPAAPPAQ